MKKMVGIFVCMLLIATALPVSGDVVVEKNTMMAFSNGNILYVGGSGPNNYTSIQDAIDDASDGYTIYVYDDSSPYYEHILIDKSLTLVGEDRETTIVDGNKTDGHVVNITANKVNISGFTIQYCGHWTGIMVHSSNNYIHHCKIKYNTRGIQFSAGLNNEFPPSWGNKIKYNIISNNSSPGLMLDGTIGCTVVGNMIINNREGMYVGGFGFHRIEGNVLADNHVFGVHMNSGFNKIVNNEFRNNKIGGLDVWHANFNRITKNNFIDNGETNYRHAEYGWSWWQYWNNNYWSPRPNYPSNSSKPYFILPGDHFYTYMPFNIDWHPAQEPYNI